MVMLEQLLHCAQSRLTLFDPMDSCPPGSSVHEILYPWDSPVKHTGVGGHFLLQGIFLTQGSNPHLLHRQVDSLPLNHLGSHAGAIAVDKQKLQELNEMGWCLGQGTGKPKQENNEERYTRGCSSKIHFGCKRKIYCT